jgi:hypothetical protein
MAVTRGVTTSIFTASSNGTTADITHTVDVGTTLTLVSFGLEAGENVVGTPEWSLGGGEPLTLVHATTASGSNGDVRVYTYGLINPTAGSGTVDIVISTTDTVWSTAVNYLGTVATSVADATNFLQEKVNNSTAAGTVFTPAAGSAGNALYAACTFKGGDGDPASNRLGSATFNDIFNGATGISGTSDQAYYVIDLLDGAPSAVTVDWNAVDENAGHYIEIVAAAGAGATLTGVEGTSAVGSVSPEISKAIIGVEGTSAVGSVTASISVTVPITGVEGTSAVGSLGFTKSGSVALTGVEGTSAVGSLGFTKSGTVALTGVEGTSAVGSVGFTKGGSAGIIGVEGTSAVGSVGSVHSVALTGVEGTSVAGNVIVSGDVTIPITGVEGTSAVGSVSPGTSVSITGVEGTSAVGSVGSVHSVALIGVEGTSAVGSVAAGGDVIIPITGVEGTSAVGSVGLTKSGSVSITGIEGTSAVGSVSLGTSVAITGVEGTSAVGSVSTGADVEIGITGVEGTSAVGSLGFTKSGTVALTGVEATSAVGSVTVAGAVVAAASIDTGGQISITRFETAAPISLSVNNSGGVTGLTVSVKVRDNLTTNSYLDFDDDTFKTSGWVQKSLALNDLGDGQYYETLDITAITNIPNGKHLILEYDILGSVVGIAQGVLTFLDNYLTLNTWIGLK